MPRKGDIESEQRRGRFYDVSESVQESLYIHRSGWGHLRADIEVNGDFLEAGKHVVTEEDFIGSTCEINYVIRQEKLGKGNQYGEIIVKPHTRNWYITFLHPEELRVP